MIGTVRTSSGFLCTADSAVNSLLCHKLNLIGLMMSTRLRLVRGVDVVSVSGICFFV